MLDAAYGYYLIAFAIVILLLAATSIAGRPLLSIFLAVSTLRVVLGAVYELGGGHEWGRASGWVALVVFGIALYGGTAFLLEDTLGRTILPLARSGAARTSIEAGLPDQLSPLADEAGVRRSL